MRLGSRGVDLAGEGVEDIREEEGVEIPAVGLGVVPGGGRVWREPLDQDREASRREPAAPVVREVDAVEALKVSLYDVGRLTKQGGERC